MVLVLLAAIGCLAAAGCIQATPPRPATMRDTLPPWPAPPDAVSYIEAAGVEPEPYAPAENPRHVRLRVVIDGAAVAVPAWVGIDRARAVQAPAHTHDDSGAISVEGAGAGPITLGQFFILWGVRLSKSCVGGACGALTVLVDGQPVITDVRAIRLSTAESIELVLSSS